MLVQDKWQLLTGHLEWYWSTQLFSVDCNSLNKGTFCEEKVSALTFPAVMKKYRLKWVHRSQVLVRILTLRCMSKNIRLSLETFVFNCYTCTYENPLCPLHLSCIFRTRTERGDTQQWHSFCSFQLLSFRKTTQTLPALQRTLLLQSSKTDLGVACVKAQLLCSYTKLQFCFLFYKFKHFTMLQGSRTVSSFMWNTKEENTTCCKGLLVNHVLNSPTEINNVEVPSSLVWELPCN